MIALLLLSLWSNLAVVRRGVTSVLGVKGFVHGVDGWMAMIPID
jgi:hypothetical protein